MDREESQPAMPAPGESWWLLEVQKLKIEALEAQLGALEEKARILASQNEYLQRQNQILLDKISQEQSLILYINNAMTQSSDSSQKISVGGDFNITANQSVVNLRDSVGAVNNAIAEIPGADSREGEDLKRLLQELTTAIELEASLDDEEKAEAVNQVKKIAQAAQKPEDQGLNAKAKRAVGFLETLAKGVEPSGKLAQTCAKALPWIVG